MSPPVLPRSPVAPVFPVLPVAPVPPVDPVAPVYPVEPVEPGDPVVMHDLKQMPTAAPGFQTRNEVVADYARLTGTDVSDFQVFRVLAMYKLAVVLLQLHALWQRGAAKGDDYAKLDKIAAGLLAFTHDVAHGRAD